MSALVWSLNGKYFKDFGVSVSSSDGLMDKPAQKKTDTYDWPEYNGLVVDISKKPRYGSREIQIAGWVEGLDWVDMKIKFDTLFSEFDKAGKQRLIVDGFGLSSLIFDVICEDKIELLKRFKKGKMIGFFKAKLTEHSPIKKVLSIANPNLQLAFNSPKWVEVNIDGTIESHKGVVNINKTLPNRSLTHYNFGGRNLALNSKEFIDSNAKWLRDFALSEPLKAGNEYVIKIWCKAVQNNNAYFTIGDQDGFLVNLEKTFSSVSNNEFVGKIIMPRDSNGQLVLQRAPNDDSWYQFEKLKVESGNKATDWTPAPEDVHFITIAGNIEEITNLTTNAEVLWEKL